MPNIQKLYEVYAANTARFPALYDELARQLGVSAESIAKAEIGFIPVDPHDRQGWALPERNAKGVVVGVQVRFDSGKKEAVTGSKRGLAYMVNHDTTQYDSNYGWERVSKDHPCPLCGHPDGCMYPKGEYENPNAVNCVTKEVGSTKPMGTGWLHVFDTARQKAVTQNHSLLLPSERPVLIVEGWSDVLAAYDLGFVAVGKPGTKDCYKDLPKLLTGRDVVVMGENDAGVGKAGMEATALSLQATCKNLTKLMPPTGVKDLRQWMEKGLTREALLAHIETAGQKVAGNFLADDRPVTVANQWIEDYKTINGVPSFGIYADKYVSFDGVGWEELTKNKVYKQLYTDMSYKSYMDGGGAMKQYKLTRAKVSDILQACNTNCLIEETAPCWLASGHHPDPKRLIIFQNGILDVDRYIAGDTAHMMLNHDPNFFSFYKLPYNFDEDAESQLWHDTVQDVFESEAKIMLAGEWFGINLVPDMKFEKLMMLKGLRRAGKGTYCNTLQFMLGGQPNASVTTFPTLRGPHGLATLRYALSAIVGDATSNGRPGSEDAILLQILNIVGRDASVVNPKHKDHIDLVRLCCRFTFAMNFFPRFRDDAGALEDRTMILTFTNSHSNDPDITLKDRLAKDASEGGIVNWALRGLKRLYTNGRFTVPAESAAAMKEFAEMVSPLGHFMQRCLDGDSDGPGVADNELWELWKWWCLDAGLKYGGKSDFIHKLLAMTPGARQLMPGVSGNKERMILGVKMSDWATGVLEDVTR